MQELARDTVAKIARHHGVPVRDVLTANGLRSRSLIRDKGS